MSSEGYSPQNKKEINRKKCKEYYHKHRNKILKSRKEYYIKHYSEIKDRVRKYSLKVNKASRQKIVKELGNKCAKCGFDDIRALQVDHIGGGGNKERRKIKKFGRAKRESLILQNIEKYQLLCANCNWIKRDENQEYRK